MIRKKKKIAGRKGVLNDECERSDNPRRSGSGVREAERRSLFHSKVMIEQISVPALNT